MATLQELASSVAEWFPELNGRALAVSEAEVTKENVPTLPLAMVSLGALKAEHAEKTARLEIEERIFVQFWLKPERYPLADGGQSPFWAFYNYETIQDRLFAKIIDWRSKRQGRLRYVAMDIEADQYAVLLTFAFDHCFIWCEPEGDAEEPTAPVFGVTISPRKDSHAAPKNPDC